MKKSISETEKIMYVVIVVGFAIVALYYMYYILVKK